MTAFQCIAIESNASHLGPSPFRPRHLGPHISRLSLQHLPSVFTPMMCKFLTPIPESIIGTLSKFSLYVIISLRSILIMLVPVGCQQI